MTTLTVNIDNEKDLPVIREILTRFGLNYKIDQSAELNKEEKKLLTKLKKSFKEINDWEKGKVNLQNAKEAIAEIEIELNNGI
ncbi:hypothetical protein KXD93_13170 [Mucilaginibacter sp. BJC16-A38]|uniref:hypothetical protein n=1 Tax=Mucilaginibacter phenanthrenivorans TaxID=1234842 RepID=UPI002157895A|nr:hypothetical protein [Mucilaginibacter phenanthrenivorans]MCR8558600.1 hypothetical protein [Mucilaginibacter phenanthrenivorans]